MSTVTPVSSPGKQKILLTADDLWQMPGDGRRYELVKGELVEITPVGPRHGWIVVRLAAQLNKYVEAHDLGYVMVEAGFCLECQPDTVRAPDIAFLTRERMPPEDHEGFVPGAPDLAVEVVSPSERDTDIQDKVMDYLRLGTRLVWIVRPRQRTITVYRPDGTVQLLQETDILDGAEVLPGFRLPMREVFAS